MVKQIRAHEIGVALVMILGKTHILVQIHGLHPGEVQVAGLILGDQLLVGAHRAGAGGQAQHAVGLQINLGSDNIGGLPAHVGVILGNNQSHRKNSFQICFLCFDCSIFSKCCTELFPGIVNFDK